jgi:CheY-like chemotaxis protein
MVVNTGKKHDLEKTKGKVLIVDDEPAIRNILARILSNKGHQAQTVSSGKAALAMLHEKGYDLLVADLKMSGLSGMDLYETLKKKRPDMADRTVFITGDTMTEETNDFLASSGRPYLAKPFTPMEFLEIIENALEGK